MILVFLLFGLSMWATAQVEEPGKVTLTFLNPFVPGDPTNQFELEIIDLFMEAHPEIEIVQENLQEQQYHTKIQAAAAGGTLTDLVLLWPGARSRPIVEQGLIRPLDDLLNSDPAWKAKFAPAALEGAKFDGKIYLIPRELSPTHAMFHNTDYFKQAGVEFPRTYEQLKRLAPLANNMDLIPISLGNRDGWVVNSCYLSTIADRITGSQWVQDVLDGRAAFTDAGFIRALVVLVDMVDVGLIGEGFNQLNHAQQRVPYYKGDAVMFIEGLWAIQDMIQNCPKEIRDVTEFGIFPEIAGGKGNPNAVSGVAGFGAAITAGVTGEKLEAAKQFMRFYYGDGAFRIRAYAGVGIGYNVDLDRTRLDRLVAKKLDFLTAHPFSPVYDATFPADAINVVNSDIQAMMIGRMSPERVAENFQNAYEKAK
jgi:raffinose/stachyose/melibiose transport system substrate-binding protein